MIIATVAGATERPYQNPILGPHGLVDLCQTPGGRYVDLAGVADSVVRTFKRGASTDGPRVEFVELF